MILATLILSAVSLFFSIMATSAVILVAVVLLWDYKMEKKKEEVSKQTTSVRDEKNN